MKPEDKALANIAEAAKRVMNKETEVQSSDKDFVDLHSIDKEKRRGSTPLEEKDVEEANEFTKAAAKAAVAGEDEFEFEGKKYPTEMDVDVAKKILGESTEVKEGKFDKLKKKLKSINPETLGDVLNGKIKLSSDEKKEFDRFMADAQKMFGKEFVKSFEAFDIEEGKFDKLKKKLKGINPETLSAVLKGKIKLDPDERKEFDSYMADAKKMFGNLPKSSPIKKMFGKEFVKALESVEEAKSESDDFEPHWMYDPETGEKERAEKPEDHERLKALGWGHEPPKEK